MNEEFILNLLVIKHQKGFAFFPKFRPMTSFSATLGEIDALAIGLWDQNSGIIAYEIKTSLQDFRSDVDKFKHKHRFALEISTEFYYVCPWGLIPKNEIPEVAGLMYINAGNKFNKIKRAIIREYQPIEFAFLQGIASRCGAVINVGEMPVRFLGKEVTAGDIEKLASEKIGYMNDWRIKKKAKELIAEKTKTHNEIIDYWGKLLNVGGLCKHDLNIEFNELLNLVEVGKNISEIKQKLKPIRNSINKLLEKRL